MGTKRSQQHFDFCQKFRQECGRERDGMRRTHQRIVCAGLLFLFLAAPSWAQQVSLTILHTNDTHVHLLPFNYPSVASEGSDIAALKTRRNIGGIARRAALVKRLKTEIEAEGSSVWLVDA